MSTKKDSENKQDEQEELVSAETDSQNVESDMSDHDAEIPSENHEEEESVQSDASHSDAEVELSADDLLEDVRRSLIEEKVETDEKENSKWWKKIGKGSRKKKSKKEEAPQTEVENMPVEPPVVEVEKQDEYVEQLDELIDMLADDDAVETELPASEHPMVQVDEPEPEPEPEVVDLKELKERAFRSRGTPEEEERNLSEVRSVALDDGEEVFIEVEAKQEDQRQDRMKAMENALKPYRRYFYFLFVFVSLVMVALVSASLYRVYQRSLPPPPTEVPSLLPYPVGMNLPGGLNFNLGKGKLQDGRWNPRGPEWLEGTEICRWIAVPYSRQLEAVVRTLTREDQIELTMSNNDVLTYNVESIDQLTLEEMQNLDANSPCMLLVLAQADTDDRWVVTAVP